MQYHFVEEFRIDRNLEQSIRKLLQDSFQSYPDRHYYKQVPNFRFYVMDQDHLIAHVAVEHRIIGMAKEPKSIFGIVDLCVAKDYKNRGIARELLKRVETLGQECEIDFAVLFADDDRLYSQVGYQHISNVCRWLMINEHQTIGVAKRSLSDCMMAKSLGNQHWVEGEVDLMGTVF